MKKIFEDDLEDDLRPEYDFSKMQIVARGPGRQNQSLSRLKIDKKTGREHFRASGSDTSLTLLDFWRWSSSDLVDNTMRGVLAEYIVASDLGLTQRPRVGWDAFDLETPSGIKIEVKSAAYLQSWFQKKLSNVCFNIRPTRKYDADTNELASEVRRQADVYVFCLLTEKDKNKLDPLDLDQWIFYIVLTPVLDKAFPTQKSIGLAALERLNPYVAKYGQIKSCIESLGLSGQLAS
jgi:hypothetical protein